MRYSPLVALLLSGCLNAESFRLRDPSCEVDFTGWHGGLTYHLLQGTGDGSFDYDPAGNVERSLAGSYDLQTGDFAWAVSYAPASYLSATEVEGYGYAKLDGDLDALYTVTETDVLGEISTWMVDEDRVGCDVDRVQRHLDDRGRFRYDTFHTGEYVQGGYEFSESVEVGSYQWDATGVRSDDDTWTRTVTQSGEDYVYTADESGDSHEGTSRVDWVQEDYADDLVFQGYDERWMDGRRHRYYSFEGDSGTVTWDYTVDYYGDGTGTYSQPGLECDVEYDAWDCTLYCPGGQTYDCG